MAGDNDNHAYFLEITEGNPYGTPHLYITPIWADIDSHDRRLSISHDTPNHGLVDVSYRGFLYNGDEAPIFKFCSMLTHASLPDLETAVKILRRTARQQTTLIAEMGDRLTHGQKCAAWAKAFKMRGVLFDRHPGDPRRSIRVHSPAVAYVIDNYVDEWVRRINGEDAAIAAREVSRGETLLLPPAS